MGAENRDGAVMRIDTPVGNVAPADETGRRDQIDVAIQHLQAALKVIDGQGQTPDLGARVEECIDSLRQLLDREL